MSTELFGYEDFFSVDSNIDVDIKRFDDTENFALDEIVGHYRIRTSRHNFNGKHNYHTVIYDESKVNPEIEYLANKELIIAFERFEEFEEAIRTHFSILYKFKLMGLKA